MFRFLGPCGIVSTLESVPALFTDHLTSLKKVLLFLGCFTSLCRSEFAAIVAKI